MITCILTSHEKPGLVDEAIHSVLAQTCTDWQLVVADSGTLTEAGHFGRYEADFRVTVMDAGKRGQGHAINECFRRGLVRGDLAVYLSDDQVYDPGAFAAFAAAAHERPGESAWYGRCQVTDAGEGGEASLGELPWGEVYDGGNSPLDRMDGMQVCHRTSVRVPWPEDPAQAYHADGLFLKALAREAPLTPLDFLVGRHRHTPLSLFTRPGGLRRAGVTEEFRRGT